MRNSSVEDTYFEANYSINVAGNLMDLSRPKIMGILNTTDDSFYSESRISSIDKLLEKAQQMLSDGADILDIGGYSTRPNALVVSEMDEIHHTSTAIKALKNAFPHTTISIDTFRYKVAEEAIKAGAGIINDISGGQFEPRILNLAAESNSPFILMHLKGSIDTMHDTYSYDNIGQELVEYFLRRTNELQQLGIKDIVLDPGFGFSKDMNQNHLLLKNLFQINNLDFPMLVGVSRKSMIYKKLNTSPENSLNGTIALNAIAIHQGAKILRVHDVKEAKEVIDLLT